MHEVLRQSVDRNMLYERTMSRSIGVAPSARTVSMLGAASKVRKGMRRPTDLAMFSEMRELPQQALRQHDRRYQRPLPTIVVSFLWRRACGTIYQRGCMLAPSVSIAVDTRREMTERSLR